MGKTAAIEVMYCVLLTDQNRTKHNTQKQYTKTEQYTAFLLTLAIMHTKDVIYFWPLILAFLGLPNLLKNNAYHSQHE